MVSSDDVPQESVIQYTVDIPEALPPNLHGEGAHTLYCCTVMAERPHALARRTISWCAPLRLDSIGRNCFWRVFQHLLKSGVQAGF